MITQEIWFAVNKNGQIVMFLNSCPHKNNLTGLWEGEQPYVNSKLYNEISMLVQQAQMSFEIEPQCIEIQFDNNK